MANYKKNKVKGYQGGGHVPLYNPSQLDIGRPPSLGEGSWIDLQPDSVQHAVRRMMFPDVPYDWGRHEQQRQQWDKDQEFRDKLGLSNPSYPLSEENIKNYNIYGKLMKLRNEQAEKYALSRPSQRWNFGWRGDADRARAAELAQRNLDIEGLLLEQQIGYNTPSLRRKPTVMPSPVPVQGFQAGGRAGTALALQSAGMKTQRDLEDDYEEQQDRQAKYDMWGNLLGVGAGLAGSMLLPGLGGLIAPKLGTFLAGSGTSGWMGSALGKALGRGVASAVPKALAKYAVSSSYKPKQFTSKTGFGLDKYGELRDRGSKFRQRGQEAAGVGMLTDIGMAMLPNPLTGKPAGTMGPGPVEWGGYTPTSDALHTAALQRNPEVENILQQSMLKEQPIPAFGKTPQTLGGGSPTFKLGDTPVEAQASIFGKVPSADTMYNQALQNRAAERAAFSAMTPLKGMQQAPLQQQLNPIRQLLESQYQVGAPSIPQNLFPGGGYQIPTVPPPGQMPYYPPANYPW